MGLTLNDRDFRNDRGVAWGKLWAFGWRVKSVGMVRANIFAKLNCLEGIHMKYVD